MSQATRIAQINWWRCKWRSPKSCPSKKSKQAPKHLLIWLLLAVCLVGGDSAEAQSSHSNLLPPLATPYHQHNNILHFVVPEGAPVNTYLGNIRSADNQMPSYVLPTPQTPESERLAALSVNLTSGDLTTCGQLDRELREQYHFIAIVSSPFAEIKCTVTVKDINDNAPMFIMPPNENNFVIEIPEGQRGIRRLLPMAVDFDSFQFGVQEFHFLSGNTPTGTFKIVEHEAPASPINVASDDSASSILAPDNPQLQQQLAQQASVLIPSQPIMQSAGISNSLAGSGSSPAPQRYLIDLEVNQTLDRENQSSYQLVLEAVDKGQPPLYGRLMVTINVQDVNDNDPVFTRKNYECHFREDTPKGTVLVRVQAHDDDFGPNSQISYLIKRQPSTTSQSNQQTNSNSNSSDINTIELSSSSNNRYATNNKRPLSSAQNSANGKLNTRQQNSNEMYETTDTSSNAVNNQFKNSKSSISPNGGLSQDQLFEIDPIKGEIYLAHQLDFETDQLHEIQVEARDHGKPSRSSFATVKVFVIDINDDVSVAPISRASVSEGKHNNQAPSSEASKSDRIPGDGSVEISQNFLQNLNLSSWFAQINSSLLFLIVLVALFAVAFSVCLVKTKSHQAESDYTDTAGLTLTSNNGQAKQSPNHSTNNEHQNGNENHHRHHDHQRRSINGSFGGHNGTSAGFGSPNGKLSSRYHCDSSNLYYNPQSHQTSRRMSSHLQSPESPSSHQVATGIGGSAGGTMMLHNNHGLLSSQIGPHSLEHHPFLNANNAHHSSSLTYAHHHSRAALLHQAHHHQSSHHLSSIHHGHNKGGTMNSVGTHHSAHPSASPLPATPNTTHSSGLPQNLADIHHGHGHNTLLPMPPSSQQLPPTPCNAIPSVFPWPQGPGSTMGTMNFSACAGGGPMHNGGTLDGTPGSNPTDCWFDLDVSSQFAHDWYSSYDWDYLSDWAPEYHTVMPLIEGDACGY